MGMEGYLSGIRHLHLEHHLDNPNIGSMAQLEQVLRSIKSLQVKVKGVQAANYSGPAGQHVTSRPAQSR